MVTGYGRSGGFEGLKIILLYIYVATYWIDVFGISGLLVEMYKITLLFMDKILVHRKFL